MKKLLLNLLCALSASVQAGDPKEADPQTAFFSKLENACGARFEGVADFPKDPGEAFRGKTLVALIKDCGEREIRIPFQVGTDHSRTWIITRTASGLRLKHDHRHADGSPDEITLYGGDTASAGTAFSQSFPADPYTANLIPEAATNVWTLSLSEDGKALEYALDRHGQPRFRTTLRRVP